MKRLLIALTLLIALAANRQALFAHGIPLEVTLDGGGQLKAVRSMTYDPDESELIAGATAIRGAAGFYPEPGVVPTGTQLHVDAAGVTPDSLAGMYWDGSTLGVLPVDVSLTRTGISMTVTPTTKSATGGLLNPFNGLEGGHTALTISIPLGSPTGLYAIGFRASTPTLGQTKTFWGVANYGLTDPAAVEAGLAAIQASVPEPSGASLALAASLAGAFGAVFRARRKHTSRGA